LVEIWMPGDQSPPEGPAHSQQGLLLGQACTGLAILRPTAEGQRQEAGVAPIELTHQSLGSSHQGILIAAPASLAHLIEVALQGHCLKREAPEQKQHGNPQGQGQNEAALLGRRERGFAGNDGSHGTEL
jgi:hypothetical protein